MAQQMQSLQQIPAEVQQLAEIHSLGAPTASYSEQTFLFWLILIVSLFFLLFLIAVFILGLLRSAPLFIALILLILIAVLGWYVIYSYLWTRKQQIHMYTEGFVYLRWRKAEQPVEKPSGRAYLYGRRVMH
jgi:uncharacterized membrane protein YbhN (UPF0104 family)